MTPRYSSVTAFIAHWQALRHARPRLGTSEKEQLAAMEKLIAQLTPAECEALALDPAPATGEAVRRYQRAEWKLHRILAAAARLQD